MNDTMARIRPAPIESLEAYKHISPDSGIPTVVHPHYNPKIKAHTPPDLPLEEFTPPKDRGSYADPEKKALFAVARSVDLTESIGTPIPYLKDLSRHKLIGSHRNVAGECPAKSIEYPATRRASCTSKRAWCCLL